MNLERSGISSPAGLSVCTFLMPLIFQVYSYLSFLDSIACRILSAKSLMGSGVESSA